MCVCVCIRLQNIFLIRGGGAYILNMSMISDWYASIVIFLYGKKMDYYYLYSSHVLL